MVPEVSVGENLVSGWAGSVMEVVGVVLRLSGPWKSWAWYNVCPGLNIVGVVHRLSGSRNGGRGMTVVGVWKLWAWYKSCIF